MNKELIEKLILFKTHCPNLNRLYKHRLNKKIKTVYCQITGRYKIEKLPKNYEEVIFENTLLDIVDILLKTKDLTSEHIEFINKLFNSCNEDDTYMGISIIEGSTKNNEFAIMKRFW